MNKIKFLRYRTLESTNQKLYQLANEGAADFSVVSTLNQTKGKGQRGTSWESTSGQNITLSFLLRFDQLEINDIFLISLWISVHLHKYLSICQIKSKIKWPNDIIINRKKVGGILIENKIIQKKIIFSVIGIGLNVYQENFYGLKKATSIKNEYPLFNIPLDKLDTDLIFFLYENKNLLSKNNWDDLLNYYYKNLLGYNKVSTFIYNGKQINGIIKGINREGKLKIKLENYNKIKNFDIKEISLLY